MEVVPQEDQVIEENDLRYDVSIELERFAEVYKKMLDILLTNLAHHVQEAAAKGSKPVRCDYCLEEEK